MLSLHVALLRELLLLKLGITSSLDLHFREYSSSLKERGKPRLEVRNAMKEEWFFFVARSTFGG